MIDEDLLLVWILFISSSNDRKMTTKTRVIYPSIIPMLILQSPMDKPNNLNEKNVNLKSVAEGSVVLWFI